MATKKLASQNFSVTGTIDGLQVSLDIKATDLASALEASKTLKVSDFITGKGDIYDCYSFEITSVWKN